jgi:1,4-dihydroxy-6-naphthoate synthase
MADPTCSRTIRIGHSPDPDDAFMFYGFASGAARIEGCEIEHVLRDIQSLNILAAGPDALEVTAMSAHAYFGLEDRYALLPVGTSVGRRYGPRVVARAPMALGQLEGATLALPGPLTTATLVARGLLPPFNEKHVPFTEVIEQVQSGAVDAGVLIHEGQLTYASLGLHLVADLDEEFARHFGGLPLPLGVNCVRRNLGEAMCQRIESAYRQSVQVALTRTSEAVDYAMQYGRGLSAELTDRFVRMYVNEDSLALSDDVQLALSQLKQMYRAHRDRQPGSALAAAATA